MKEKEIRGYIKSKEAFELKIQEFSQKFGSPTNKRRLALTLGDYANFDIETKIRITNGEISITQKLGDQNAVSREENEIEDLTTSAESLTKLYKMFETFTHRGAVNMYAVGIQHENYLFYSDSFEIKLFRQFNDEHEFFAFEVEQFEEGDKDIFEFTAEVGLEVAENYNTAVSAEKRNAIYNIDLKNLSGDDLKTLVEQYL